MIIKLINFIILSFLIASCNGRDNSFVSETEDNTLRVATFNIAWLGDGIDDNLQRNEDDYKEIAKIISDLDADVISLQEIENLAALKRILKYLDDFSFIMPEKYYGRQNLAILYHTKVDVIFDSIYENLIVAQDTTRSGLAITCKKNGFDCKIIAVHLKSTSRYDSTDYAKKRSREIRLKQALEISKTANVILEIENEDDIIIIGDFNDYPERKDNNTLFPIIDNEELHFLTAGIMSCKFEYLQSIDHIVGTNDIKERIVNNSLFIYNLFDIYEEDRVKYLSDHCPIVLSIDISGSDLK